MTDEKWIKLIKNKAELNDIPVIANVDLGQTTPICTVPMGGVAKIVGKVGKASILIRNPKSFKKEI